jgi:signal transduction histidine kinase
VTPQSALRDFVNLIKRSLAARLLAIAILSVAGLALVAWISYTQFNRELMRLLIDPQIESVADDLISNAIPGLSEGDIALRDLPYDPRYMRGLSGRYFQIAKIEPDARLIVRYISPSLVDVAIDIDAATARRLTASATSAQPHFINLPGPDRESLRVVARVARIPGLDGDYLFVVGVASGAILADTNTLLAPAIALFMLFCAFVIAGLAALQVWVGLRPLRDFTNDIAAVRRGDSERLNGEYPAELLPVAGELNALIDHNREVVERARRHVGNLAHALKTPIAVLKNAAAEGRAGDAVLKQSVEEMESFVERQLRRARVAARADARAGPQAATIAYRTPVNQNLSDLVFMMEQKYDHAKAMDISLEVEGDLTFRGEREDLLEMAANLIDNACKYGKSQVVVRVRAPADVKGVLDIIVEDDGPGLSEADIARAKARGARLDEAAPGQGLGLSILLETVELYAGEISFCRSALGGLEARLRLPATD